jgi:hypothetical protein
MGRSRIAAGAPAPARDLSLRLALCAAAFGIALGVLAGAVTWLVGSGPAEAQQGTRTVIVVPAVIKAQAASKTPLPIKFTPPDSPAKNSFVRIHGLPFASALSEGHAIAPGAWAVPLNALPTLGIILPVGLQGSSEISVSLVNVDGTVLAEAKSMLTVEAASATTRADPPITREPVVRPLPTEERERALGLHAKGLEMLERGNVYAARKFFERAAEIGLPQSAVALAATYDPDELSKLKVVGLSADAAAARKWYEKARELGAPEAGDRLRRLGAVR